MKLTVEDQSDYQPSDHVYAFRDGLPYGFEELAAHTSDGGVCVRDEILFVESSIVAKMFDFNHTVDGDRCILSQPGATIELVGDTDALTVNGTKYDFTTTYVKDGFVMVDIQSFASMLGYGYVYDETTETHYIVADPTKLTEAKKIMFDERFDLYRDVVYNYDDVECDNTGVGIYEKVDPDDRIVGIAYTTWHRSSTNWG